MATHQIKEHQSFLARTCNPSTDCLLREKLVQSEMRRFGCVGFYRHLRILCSSNKIFEPGQLRIPEGDIRCRAVREQFIHNKIGAHLLSPRLDMIRHFNVQKMHRVTFFEIN